MKIRFIIFLQTFQIISMPVLKYSTTKWLKLCHPDTDHTYTQTKPTNHPTTHKHTHIAAVSPRRSWQAAMYTWWCYHHISHIVELMFLRGHWWKVLSRRTAVRTPSLPSPNFLLLLLLCLRVSSDFYNGAHTCPLS